MMSPLGVDLTDKMSDLLNFASGPAALPPDLPAHVYVHATLSVCICLCI